MVNVAVDLNQSYYPNQCLKPSKIDENDAQTIKSNGSDRIIYGIVKIDTCDCTKSLN